MTDLLEVRDLRTWFHTDRGIVKFVFRVSNQDDATVLNYLDTVMFARRMA